MNIVYYYIITMFPYYILYDCKSFYLADLSGIYGENWSKTMKNIVTVLKTINADVRDYNTVVDVAQKKFWDKHPVLKAATISVAAATAIAQVIYTLEKEGVFDSLKKRAKIKLLSKMLIKGGGDKSDIVVTHIYKSLDYNVIKEFQLPDIIKLSVTDSYVLCKDENEDVYIFILK